MPQISNPQKPLCPKRSILIQALKTAWNEITKLKELCLEKNIVLHNFSAV